MSAAPKFHKIESGLYGTGITETKHRGLYFHCSTCAEIEEDGGDVVVEWVIDKHTSIEPGWDLRQRCEHGHFTDLLGLCWRTLGDAKADIIEGAW